MHKLDTLVLDFFNRLSKEKLEGRCLTFEFKNTKFEVKQRSITKNLFIGRKFEELALAAHKLFKIVHDNQDGVRMLCLRMTLLRCIETGVISEPAAALDINYQQPRFSSADFQRGGRCSSGANQEDSQESKALPVVPKLERKLKYKKQHAISEYIPPAPKQEEKKVKIKAPRH